MLEERFFTAGKALKLIFIGQVIGVRADDIVVMNFAAIEQSRNAKIEFIELQRFVYLQQRQGAL